MEARDEKNKESGEISNPVKIEAGMGHHPLLQCP
jgi:hypothetical protein